ncbi:DNA-binding transcriptional regulator, GntR family [Burkholderia sp. D7]|jgi:DNA-binding GntR family transcriptional regulator|nr:DNA-binding transcriptional regulator, GntR family [Burkholderia sp. D7]
MATKNPSSASLEDDSSLILRKDLVGEVVTRLQNDITSGVYKPGERITEQGLAKRFGVSRTPLRVALQVVAAEGLLELQLNRGAVVPTFTAEDVKGKLAVTGALIELAVQSTCDLANEDDIEELFKIKAKVSLAFTKRQSAKYFEQVDRFHRHIVLLAKNSLLLDLYDIAHRHVMRTRSLGHFQRQLLEATDGELDKLLEALRQRNKRSARAASARHTQTVIDSVGRDVGVDLLESEE